MTVLTVRHANSSDTLVPSRRFGIARPWMTNFPLVDTFEGEILDPQSLHKYAYVHGDPVNNIDPSGRFAMTVGMMTAGSIRNMMASSYLGAGTGVSYSVEGLQRGLTVKQVLLGYALDTLLGPVDDVIYAAAALVDALHDGVSFIVDRTGIVSEATVDRLIPAGAVLIGAYATIRRPASIYQPHHLNQWAAFRPAFERAGISRKKGAAIMIEGGTNDPERLSEHYRFHRYLNEHLWSRYRGTDDRPTVGEYNRVYHDAMALMRGRATADLALKFARAEQQQVLRLTDTSLVPRIPRR